MESFTEITLPALVGKANADADRVKLYTVEVPAQTDGEMCKHIRRAIRQKTGWVQTIVT